MLRKNLATFLLVFSVSSTLFANVWPTENQWSDQWESTYSKWVETQWDDEVFMRTNSIVYGLKTDCADASYTMRMLFSYLNKLPFQIYDNARRSPFLTNESNLFDSETDPQKRFIRFVNDVNDNTDSGSLANDTYPVEISRKYIRPGIVYVSPNDHTYQIIKVNENGVVTIMSSTVPKDLRYLNVVHSFPTYMPKDFLKNRDGYRAFKQPQHYAMKKADLPGYSLQQYELSKQYGEDILGYGDALAHILQTRPETMGEKIDRGMLNLCNALQSRSVFVAWTVYKLSQQNYTCFSREKYEAESTPSRDKRIHFIFTALEKLYNLDRHNSASTYSSYFNEIFDSGNIKSTSMNWCAISKYGNIPTEVSFRDVWHAIQNNKFISDPNATINQRWGLEDYVPRCPQY
jgi:hypothetical protein